MNEIEDLPDFSDEDLDKLLESLDKEHEKLSAEIEEANETIDLCLTMIDCMADFTTNMKSLSLAFPILDSTTDRSENFLNGVIYSGIISAYEGCIHDIMIAVVSKSSYLELAITRWNFLSTEDRNHLRVKNKPTSESIKSALRKRTLHDPNQISRIVKALFDLDIPSLPTNICTALMNARNAYTHNNGKTNGSNENISARTVKFTYNLIMGLINNFSNSILHKVDDPIHTGARNDQA